MLLLNLRVPLGPLAFSLLSLPLFLSRQKTDRPLTRTARLRVLLLTSPRLCLTPG